MKLFKYHGLGNDFLVLDRRAGGGDIDEALTRRLCDRHRGVGADGVLVLLPSHRAWAHMVVHNADGSVPEMCGNGLRCAVKYLVDHYKGKKPAAIPVETGAGVLQCAVTYGFDGKVAEVEVAMGPARLVAPSLPSSQTGRPFVQKPVEGYTGTAVSMGNPHLVLFDAPLKEASRIGPTLERATGFPDRTNVEFAQVDGGEVTLVVWERGVGLTQACGTGACAAVAVAVHLGKLPAEQWVQVTLPGGKLAIRVAKGLAAVDLRGPAELVFETTVPSTLAGGSSS